MSRVSIVLPGVLWLCACGAPPTATPKVEPKPAAANVDGKQVEVKTTGEKFPERRAALVSRMAAMKTETNELIAAYASGTLGDRLVAAAMVIVDAKAPADTDQTDYYLVPGTVPADGRTHPALRARQKTKDSGGVKRMLVGGEDGAKPVVFRQVEPGVYTACAAVGPANTPEKEAYLAKAKEMAGEDDPTKLDPAKLLEASRKAQVATGYKPIRIDWDKVAVRCKEFTVTAEAASRVVVLDPA
jgi:hypothetical protein